MVIDNYCDFLFIVLINNILRNTKRIMLFSMLSLYLFDIDLIHVLQHYVEKHITFAVSFMLNLKN